jgi:hypothetical protein
VGTVLGVRTRSPSWFGEGDEKIYIDGEAKASIWGTGTEDYFLSAWGLQKASTPYFGVPFYDQRGIGGHTSAYRWHVADPMVFAKGIKVAIEHMGWMSEDENAEYKATSWNEREDDYSSVAFWYQTGKPTFAARAPGAAERKLPSLDRVAVRAADAATKLKSGAVDISKQPSDPFGGEEIVAKPTAATGGWIEIPFEVKAKEPLHLVLLGATSDDGGRWQASLDGVKLGRPLDFYDAERTDRVFELLDFWPEPGTYTLRLECVGRNARSTGAACTVESVRLLERRPRVAAMGHDKDKDWRKDPKLYR